jgi:hypothetical protein
MPSRIADRILDRYRKMSGAKPLPAGGMIRLRLSSPSGAAAAKGSEEVLWEPSRYRETVSSAGMETSRGIEGIESTKAWFTDEDGVTRVASEPVLRELITRSYFWRRAWLFESREGALVRLGAATDDTASVKLEPLGGNPMLLAFSRKDGRLLSVRSPRFHLEFQSATAFRDLSDPARPVSGELAWTGLPTGRLPPVTVGGGRATFSEPSTRVAMERRGGAVLVEARLAGQPIRLAIDAAASGPLRLSPALADRLALKFSADVFGRSIAPGAALEIGGASWPSLFVQRSEAVPAGADAVAGGCLFREAILELDWGEARLGLHDPERFPTPEGFYRLITDDDGNRPVVVLKRGSRSVRLTEGSDLGGAALRLAQESARSVGLEGAKQAAGLTWGPVDLPPLPLEISAEGFFPDWGDDGALALGLLARFHTFIDMPRRWTYLKPIPE